MSLILEALKKLERDKKVEDRGGFLVMAARPWPAPGGDRRPLVWALAGGGVAMALGAGVALWLWRAKAEPPSTVLARPAAAPAALTYSVPPLPPPVAPVRRAPAASRPASSAAAPAAPAKAPAVAQERAVVSNDTPSVKPQVPATAITEGGVETDPAAAAPAAVKPAGPPARFRLTAISQREGKPVAMFNERLVFEGDSVDGITVVRIGDAEIEVSVAGKREIIPFAF